jgi:hypothetical protein
MERGRGRVKVTAGGAVVAVAVVVVVEEGEEAARDMIVAFRYCVNAVSACTCAVDPYCCQTAWDEVCIAYATIYCGARCPGLPVCGSPTAGACTTEHATPACADADCCVTVCTLDAFCCETAWDATCVKESNALCFAPADVDRDGRVAAVDLAIVLDTWGSTGGAADIDGDGTVGAGDLAAVLSAWTG